MKNGKRPTRNQKKKVIEAGLNPGNWLVVKNQSDQMILVHRETGTTKTIFV
ncbi:hypothetical protein SAMN05444673_2550 [Bacillus sp. OV166]|uniref:DUF6906 family protein n=1 Tax=Bacillus sp. OV166 TaxID=1882763 RepID=UPI000A2AB6F9|nr:hypothetical protein [Bacillus sp. OV166]SMQ75826.1 hypothetical protein SAMN05444673_2550 [Bacillus sp. OV166]